MNKIIIFITYAYPNREKFFEVLDFLDKNNIYGVEIGIPSKNPYLDGDIIKKASNKVYSDGFEKKQFIEDVKKIYTKYKFKKYLMGYDAEVKEYDINKISGYYDGIIVVDSVNNLKQIPLINPKDRPEIRELKNINPDFVYLISGEGKTGSFDYTPSEYIDNLSVIKENTKIDCFVGFGIKNAKDVENIISTGADGAIIGSKFMSLLENIDLAKQYIVDLQS